MKKMTKIAMMVIGMMAVATGVNAQDKVEAEVSGDVVSAYLWRGDKLDNAAIQPTLGVSYKGFSLSAWGSYGLTSNTTTDEDGNASSSTFKELDLSLGYTIGGFNIGVTDYWSTSGDDKYFLYNNNETSHTFEANIGYDFGFVNLQWYTNFAGADARRHNGDRAYLSYVEITAPFKLGGIDWEANVGAIPYYAGSVTNLSDIREAQEEGKSVEPEHYYAANSEGFAVTNVSLKATKDIHITKGFTLPIFAQMAANPSTQKMFFAFGFTLRP